MGLVGEYNQAVTPVRSQHQNSIQRDHEGVELPALDENNHSLSDA